MRITIGILCLSICSSASIFSAKKNINLNALGDTVEVKAFFEANLDTLSSEYEKKFGGSWNPTRIKSVSEIIDVSSNAECGYLVSFNKGYIAYSRDLSVYEFDTSSCLDVRDHYYFRDNRILYKNYDEYFNLEATNASDSGMDGAFFPITDVKGLNNFVLTGCLCKIPYLMEHYPSVEYEDWLPLCMKQVENTCTSSAFSNLIFMYKEKGLDDLTIGLNPEEVRDYFGSLAGTTLEDGTSSVNIHPAMKRYLEVADTYNNNTTNRWQALAGSKDDFPTFESYYKGGMGHSAIRIGTGQSDYWWFFKSYWRIVVSWGPNYKFDENTRSCVWIGGKQADNTFGKNACIYVIDAQYAVNSWTIQR